MKEIELTEEEKRELEALYLRAELLFRDIQALNAQLQEIQQAINEYLARIAKANSVQPSSLQPEFVGYRLIRIRAEE